MGYKKSIEEMISEFCKELKGVEGIKIGVNTKKERGLPEIFVIDVYLLLKGIEYGLSSNYGVYGEDERYKLKTLEEPLSKQLNEKLGTINSHIKVKCDNPATYESFNNYRFVYEPNIETLKVDSHHNVLKALNIEGVMEYNSEGQYHLIVEGLVDEEGNRILPTILGVYRDGEVRIYPDYDKGKENFKPLTYGDDNIVQYLKSLDGFKGLKITKNKNITHFNLLLRGKGHGLSTNYGPYTDKDLNLISKFEEELESTLNQKYGEGYHKFIVNSSAPYYETSDGRVLVDKVTSIPSPMESMRNLKNTTLRETGKEDVYILHKNDTDEIVGSYNKGYLRVY